MKTQCLWPAMMGCHWWKPKMDRPEVTRSFARRRLDGQSCI
jgi:hypothetical protein